MPLSVRQGRGSEQNDDRLLQSLCFNTVEHSSAGYRCSHRYEWYQTASDVVIEIMIQNVKDDDILVEFTDAKVMDTSTYLKPCFPEHILN